MFSIFLLAAAATGDSLLIGFNFGIKKVKITFSANLAISAICLVGTYLAMLCGKSLELLISPVYLTFLGGILLTALGVGMLSSALKNSSQDYCKKMSAHPDDLDKNNSNTIEVGEAIRLGLILSINNVGLGLGASMLKMNPILTCISCGVMNSVFLLSGSVLGNKIKSYKLSQVLEKISACIVILLGLFSLIM
ncbi:MAG: manganese efflux pump [Oscillospiraceae bacterium]